ncbi:MAG TPA: hypothetical protein VGG74_10520 [Kofleriaceae bacterium]|jgi:hypothetical protein
MSKVECTAVNELVDLVRNRALEEDDADVDLFASSSPRAHHLRGTPAPSLFEMPAPPPAAPAPAPSPIAMVSLPAMRGAPVRAHRPAVRLGSPNESAASHVGSYVPLSTLGRRAALPVAGLVGLGIIAGIAYTRLSHHDAVASARSVADLTAAAAAVPTPTPTPVVVAPVPAAPVEPTVPKLVDVRLDSTPAGAIATLISNGISTQLGPTPLSTSLDPSKSYDVVFAIDGKPSKVEHLDPNATQHVEVAFDDAAPSVAATAPTKASKSSRHRGKHARVAAAAPGGHHTMPKLATPDFGDAPAAKPSKSKAADAGTGNGMLAIITSGPAAILIDDQNTGLTAPQRAIPLAAGHHNVRIIAATQHINKLVPVDISAHHTTSIKPF